MTAARRFTLVWIALLVLTFGSFAVGIEQSPSFASIAALLIIGLALVKVRLVGLHFMDLRAAPPTLRLIFEGYVLAVFIALALLDLLVTA
jgi:cbb3-type cytochrome oxidase subunit 1